MKVLVINGSPLMDNGNTALILTPFIDGMKDAGAEVEVFYIKKLKIKPCEGELSCWLRTPGTCILRDDMDWMMGKLAESNIIVISAPLYVDGIPGPVKNFIDRLIPRGNMTIEIRDGRCRHPIREGSRQRPIVLVSSCGFYELDHFDPLLAYMNAWSRNVNSPFLGALLRPTGPMFRAMLEAGVPFDDVFQAAREAGRQVIATGQMSSKTLGAISRPVMPREDFVRMHNEKVAEILESLSAK
ncbi:MAG: FMN-dependent NADH-azoreductase [Syntrophorhabdus sp. PtaU1.Bin153]|nr:MAG: FMN-dependent NADH-azoreductase [Syntrophorhabdus sp. PtaU1.Bin153]